MSSPSPKNDGREAVSGEKNDDEETYEWCPICWRFGRQPCVPCSSIEQQDDCDNGVNENEANEDTTLWEEEFAFQRCESSKTICRECGDNIGFGYLRVRHLRQQQHGSSYRNKAYYYHWRCWHSSEHKPTEEQRPLSTYYLFDVLPPSVQDQIFHSPKDSPSIRFHDPSSSAKIGCTTAKKSKKGKTEDDQKNKNKSKKNSLQRKRKKIDDVAVYKKTSPSSASPKKVFYDV